MYDIVNKAQNLTLPVVAINLASVSRASDRVFNKLDNIYNPITEKESSSIRMPIPIDITINMSILGRYMQDVEQIISNFVPYNNPYIILSWKEPTNVPNQNIEIRTEVLWNGSLNFTTPTDTTYSDKFRIVCDTSFTIKGWLFKNQNDLSAPIYFIDNNFYALRKSDLLSYDTLKDLDLEDVKDTISLSALPVITNLFYSTTGSMIPVYNSVTINKQLTGYNMFVLYGSNFNFTDNVLLSTNNPNIMNGAPFIGVNSDYTGYAVGFGISSYNVVNDNVMTVNIPYLSGSGDFNIIVSNPSGWFTTYTLSSFSFQST